MTEVLLVRHAKSYANARDVAFGNVESPLTEQGVEAAKALGDLFREKFAIDPPSYDRPVLSSEFRRPQETAHYAGFRHIETNPIINESDIPAELLRGRLIIEKHASERWIPDELRERASRFIELVRKNELGHQIYFSHGFFIAAVVSEVANEYEVADECPHVFDEKRGYIPLLATVTVVHL